MENESNTTRPNLDLLLSTIPEAMATDSKAHKATLRASVAALAVYDAAVATFGTARVLSATSRDKEATPEEKNAYVIIKEAAVSAAWSPAFLAKVNNGGAAKQSIGSPNKEHAANTRFYWQQQKGVVFGRITKRIAAELAIVKTRNAAPLSDGTKAPNRKATIDKRAETAFGPIIKALDTAFARTDGKGEAIPAHVDGYAFKRLSTLALWAMSPIKERQEQARLCLAAYDAAIAIDKASAKIDRKPKPLATKVKASKSPAPVKGQTAKQNPADIK